MLSFVDDRTFFVKTFGIIGRNDMVEVLLFDKKLSIDVICSI
jgi:hypothetical protein